MEKGKDKKRLLLLDQVIDEFVVPLANMAINERNTYNIFELCKNAKKWMKKNV